MSQLGPGCKVAWGFAHPPVPPPGAAVEGTVTAAIVRDSALLMWLPLAGAALVLIVLGCGAHGGSPSPRSSR